MLRSFFALAIASCCLVGCTSDSPSPVTLSPWSDWSAYGSDLHFVFEETASLPAALQSELMHRDEFIQGGSSLPATLGIARVDLNADNVDEFVVKSPQPYSGGPAMEIFRRDHEKFSWIGGMQGMIRLGPSLAGYREIESMSRAGGGSYTRVRQRFEEGQYQMVRIADYHWSNDFPDRFTFVLERDPRPYRH
jgi:hypothetical protein